MKYTKFLKSLLITICVLGSSTIHGFAVGVELSDDLDYTQKKQILERAITENSKELENISNQVNATKEYLVQNENEIVNIQKTYSAKKNVTKYNIGSNNDLMLLEMVLNSNSITDLLRNIDLAKDVYIQKNKALNTLTQKEEQLLELRQKANKEYESLVANMDTKQEELNNLQTAKTELDTLISRKSDDLIFNPNNLLEISNASVDDIYKCLEGTALHELAPVYIEAENLYGVNALFLVGLTAQESGWGTSRRAVEDNNLTGFGVYSDSSKGINSHTKRGNILMTAKWLKEKYLTPGAILYNGFGIRDVNVRYCIGVDGNSDFHWSENISKIASESLAKIK